MILFLIEDIQTWEYIDEYTTWQGAANAIKWFKEQNDGSYKVVVSD